jgi:arsenical pump membrane protein
MVLSQTHVDRRSTGRWQWLLGAGGVLLLGGAFAIAPHSARLAAAQTWTPFVLVMGLLLVGLAAADDGLFMAAGVRLAALTSLDGAFFIGAVVLITSVSAVLNLDTSVVFVTPVLVAAARRRGKGEASLLYGSLLLANAGSLYLPGSNLTNLIVLGHGTLSGRAFLAATWPAALSATVVTAAVLARRSAKDDAPVRTDGSVGGPTARWGAGAAGVIVSIALVLLLRSPAVPVLAVGTCVSGLQLRGGRLTLRRMSATVAPQVLLGLFGAAVAAGTLGRAWDGPATMLGHLDTTGTAILAALLSVVINNLPAAALLAAHRPSHPLALLVGLNLGPNLAVTGSLAWFLWLRIARISGAEPSLRVASKYGLLVVPLSMTVALVALWLV